jgi:hypothetical protein
MTAEDTPPEVPMNSLLHPSERRSAAIWRRLRHVRQLLTLFLILTVMPALALAQTGSSPFDTGLTSLQNLFTGTIAKVASLIAIVIGGYVRVSMSDLPARPPRVLSLEPGLWRYQESDCLKPRLSSRKNCTFQGQRSGCTSNNRRSAGELMSSK